MQLIGDGAADRASRCRCSASRRPAAGGYFDDGGFPAGKGWDEMALPAVNDEHAYALEISGDSMKPAYRDGDVIVVSPGTPIRRGDRVVVKTTGGEVMVKELKRRTAKTLELHRSIPLMSTARWRPATSNGSRGSCGRASSSFLLLPLWEKVARTMSAPDEGSLSAAPPAATPRPVANALRALAPPSPTRG